jgi:AcrR family transcriptional regulator
MVGGKKFNKSDRILEASAQLFAEKGYKGTTFREIAERVGIDKSSIFHYFKNKEELVRKILQESIYKVADGLKLICDNKHLTPEQKLKAAIENHLHFLYKYRDTTKIYLDETIILQNQYRKILLAEKKRYQGLFKKIIIENSKNFKGLNEKVVTFAILGMCNWTLKWLKKDGSLSVKEIADIFYRTLIKK